MTTEDFFKKTAEDLRQELLTKMSYFLKLLKKKDLELNGFDILSNISNATEINTNKYVITNEETFSFKDYTKRTIIKELFEPVSSNKHFSLYKLSDEEDNSLHLLVKLIEQNNTLIKKIKEIYYGQPFFKGKKDFYIWLFTHAYLSAYDFQRAKKYTDKLLFNLSEEYVIVDEKNTPTLKILFNTKKTFMVNNNYLCNFNFSKLLNINLKGEALLQKLTELSAISYDYYHNDYVFVTIDKGKILNYMELTKQKGE